MSSDIRRNMDELLVQMRQAAVDGLRDAAEHVLEEANRTVPIEEGTLMRSGTTNVDGDSLQATVSYDTPYALKQHEDLTLRHAPGRRAKWLQRTLDERERDIHKFIAEKVRAVLKG